MSDYATCVTEPFWKSHKPDAYAYFVRDGWTKVTGDRNIVSFCKVFSDLSYAGIQDQVCGAIMDVEEAVDDSDVDLRLSLIDDLGTITPFSLAQVRTDRIAAQKKRRQREEYERALHERVARDMAADNGVPNPDLDSFLS